MQKNILIVGVGGQGTLLASRIIGNTALSMGYDVKLSEVHGMSQRGGSVVTYVKYSDEKVHSPLISEGTADMVLAFETLEAYRSINYLKKDGLLLMNKQRILPMPVITGTEKYTEDISEKIKVMGISLIEIDAFALACEAGNEKTVNTVLIGAMAANGDIPKDTWINSLKETIPQRLLDVNLKAFDLGYGNN